MVKLKDMLSKYSLRFLWSLFFLIGMSEIMATKLVRNLPLQRYPTGRLTLGKQKQEKLQRLLTNDKDSVFIRTTDNKYFKLPQWQINQMPILAGKISQQAQENSLLKPFDTSQINGGITSQELQLLSDTWVQMKGKGVLPFIKTLSAETESLSLLNGAAKKVGSAILYAATSDYVLPRELRHKFVEPLIDPFVKYLQRTGYVKSQKRSFSQISRGSKDVQSKDGTKSLAIRGEQLLLYDVAHDFKPQEVTKIKDLPSEMSYQFSQDGRMIIGISKKASNGTLYCWDTYDYFKQYTIPYSGFIGDVVWNSEVKILAFTGSDQKAEFEKSATKLYACSFTQNNSQPKQLTWVEGAIESISFSSNGRQLACFSEKKLLVYDTLYDFKAQEVISNEDAPPIASITFDSHATKFICSLEAPKVPSLKLSLYVLSGTNYIFSRSIPSHDCVEIIDFDRNGDSCIVKPAVSGRLRYWNKFWEKDSRLELIGATDYPKKAKLSPDGKVCVVSGRGYLYFLYMDNPQNIHYVIKGGQGNIVSIRFNQNSEKCSILIEYPDKSPGDDPESGTVSIDELTLDFNFQDLKECNMGQAEMLYNLYYKKFLKHALRDQAPENIENIRKGTLAYELFDSLPEVLQEKMKSVLGVSVIDEPQEYEKKPTVIEEIPAQEVAKIAQKNLREYLETQKDQIDYVKEQMKKEAEQKAVTLQLIQTDSPKVVTQDPNQSQNIFWRMLSNFKEGVYRRLPSLPVWIQKWIREVKPIIEEKEYNNYRKKNSKN